MLHADPQAHNSVLLEAHHLSVTYANIGYSAVRDINFKILSGEIVGVLGESGSGKSTTAAAIMGLLPKNAGIDGSIQFRGENLLGVSEARYRQIRGAQVSFISQEPGLALSPYLCTGKQIEEVLRAHGIKKSDRRELCKLMLRQMQFSDVNRIYDAYPHQLSGGELHRVAIAQALVCRPKLVICDEATRSLDVTIQLGIVQLLKDINREFESAFLFITHNPALLAGFADSVLVMYAGQIVEQGPVFEVFRQPKHPYTKALLDLALDATQLGRDGRERLPITFAESIPEESCAQHAD